jgi:hypothetical protein
MVSESKLEGSDFQLLKFSATLPANSKTHEVVIPVGAYPFDDNNRLEITITGYGGGDVASIKFGGSVCDCGGRKAGYSDQEKHGHAHWCSVNAKK